MVAKRPGIHARCVEMCSVNPSSQLQFPAQVNPQELQVLVHVTLTQVGQNETTLRALACAALAVSGI